MLDTRSRSHLLITCLRIEIGDEFYRWLRWQRVHQTALRYRALWEEEQAVAERDPYLGGFRSTKPEVNKLLEYCHRQGLTARKFEPEEMFHPSTLST